VLGPKHYFPNGFARKPRRGAQHFRDVEDDEEDRAELKLLDCLAAIDDFGVANEWP
jgi:hypothetical protein